MRLTGLREAREGAGLSQNALGFKSGIAPDTIARLERLEREPHVSTVEKLAAALGVEPEDLVDDPEELRSKTEGALSNPSVRRFVRERGAERFAVSDGTWAERYIVPVQERLEALLAEMRALSQDYNNLKNALGVVPSRLPKAARERRREIKREASRTFWRRVLVLDMAAYRHIEEVSASDSEVESKRGHYAQEAAEARKMELGASG